MADLIDRQATARQLLNERKHYDCYRDIGIGLDIARMIVEDYCPTVQPNTPTDTPTDTPISQSKQTNADRIRAMTDEELAEWVSDMHNTLTCPNGGAISCNPSCTRCWLDWLKKEVEE